MEKKSFIILLSALIFTFLVTTMIKHYRSPVPLNNILQQMPLAKGDWTGNADPMDPSMQELLSPDRLFSASFINSAGKKVQLFVDYFSPENISGTIHSPRNCLPGSGWIIAGTTPRPLLFNGHTIHANRFNLSLSGSRQVMDFWYVTRQGETANDYTLKFNTMISSLMLRPTDKAFIRFVASDDPQSLAALEQFESLFIGEIYHRLPF
jgi:EpsI family protein